MGELALLQPQDCLNNKFHRQKLNYSSPMKSRRNSSSRSDPSKPRKDSTGSRNNNTVPSPESKPNLVMGQVKILKRGEPLTEIKTDVAFYQTSGVHKPPLTVINTEAANYAKPDVQRSNEMKTRSSANYRARRSSKKRVTKIKTEAENYRTPGGQDLKGAGLVDDFVLSTTDRLGPEPEMLAKKISLADFYAGSGVIDSPAPSSLPVPSFFSKKRDPTSELRRMLGLDQL